MITNILTQRQCYDIAVVGLGSLGKSLFSNYQQYYPQLQTVGVVRKLSKPNNNNNNNNNNNMVQFGTSFKAQHIVLSVKPYQAQEVCQVINKFANDHTVIISAMAAVSQDKLQRWFNTNNIVRIMPSILSTGPLVVYDPYKIRPPLPRNNIIYVKSENELDLSTATCGCVPGFMAAIVEQLIIAIQNLNVDRKTAENLVICNLRALANENICSVKDLEILRNNVATKGGATEKGIMELLNNNDLLNLFTKMFRTADSHILNIRNNINNLE